MISEKGLKRLLKLYRGREIQHMTSPERYEVKQKKSREKKKEIKACISVGLSQGISKDLFIS